ncbi:MAG: hypothetical protein WD990_09940 [Acidimicrobiia bacterium]
MEALLRTVHIFAAAIWVGARSMRDLRIRDTQQMGPCVMAVDQKLGSIVFGSATLLVFLAGIGLEAGE